MYICMSGSFLLNAIKLHFLNTCLSTVRPDCNYVSFPEVMHYNWARLSSAGDNIQLLLLNKFILHMQNKTTNL